MALWTTVATSLATSGLIEQAIKAVADQFKSDDEDAAECATELGLRLQARQIELLEQILEEVKK